MSSRRLLTRDQVAERLQLDLRALYRKMPELRALGFPAPAFGNMRGARWDPAAIDRWLDARGTAAAPAANLAEQDELDRRAHLLAAGGRG